MGYTGRAIPGGPEPPAPELLLHAEKCTGGERPSFWRAQAKESAALLAGKQDLWEPKFDSLIAALTSECSRARAAIGDLRLENAILRASLPSAPSPDGVFDGRDVGAMEPHSGDEHPVTLPVGRRYTANGHREAAGEALTEKAGTSKEALSELVVGREVSTASKYTLEPLETPTSPASESSAHSEVSLHEVWVRGKPKRKKFDRVKTPHGRDAETTHGVRVGSELKEDSVLQPFMLYPARLKCLAWDCWVGVVTLYDLVMVPLQVFKVSHPVLYGMDIATASTWCVDIAVCFLRGVDIGGVLDLRPSHIARNYLRTWFVPDCTIAAVDWLLILGGSDNLDIVRNMRLKRLLRVMRLLRVAKIPLRRKLRFSLSDHVVAAASLIKFLLVLWLINHYVACGWYAVGGIGLEPNWIDAAFQGDEDTWYRYATAYHWSLTQFTPASMEVVPKNGLERVYTACAIFFGLVTFSTFVSHMANAVRCLQQLNADIDKQRLDLRNYIEYREISFELGKRITAYVNTASRRRKTQRLLESDVAVFRTLPENLLNKLHEEVFAPVLVGHPFFNKIQEREATAFAAICNLAVDEQNVLIGDELFRYGQKATKMYFNTKGQLSYFRGFHDDVPELVKVDSWFSEATLWCKWTHQGRMMPSFGDAEVVHVDAKEFQNIIAATGSFPQAQSYAKLYCAEAVAECGNKEHIGDVWGGPQQVAAAVRQAWCPSVMSVQDSANSVLFLLFRGTDEWFVATFQAWKQHTAVAYDARMRNKGLLSHLCDHLRSRAAPRGRISIAL